MNDQTGLVFSFQHLGDDLVEGNDFRFHPWSKKLQREVRGSERSGDGDALGLDFTCGKGARGDDHGPVTLAYATAARHQRVLILDIRIGMERDRTDVINSLARLLIQGLDVAEGMSEAQACGANFVCGQAVEHEGVVGIGAVGHGNFAHMTCDTAAWRFCGFGYCCHWNSRNLLLDCDF